MATGSILCCARDSGIARVAMFREEEFVQQTIDLQQAFAVKADFVAGHSEIPPILQGANGLLETLDWVSAKFAFKIAATDGAEFQLQNQFTDEPLVVTGRQRAVNRQVARLYARDIDVKVMMILVMHAADVAEAGDTE